MRLVEDEPGLSDPAQPPRLLPSLPVRPPEHAADHDQQRKEHRADEGVDDALQRHDCRRGPQGTGPVREQCGEDGPVHAEEALLDVPLAVRPADAADGLRGEHALAGVLDDLEAVLAGVDHSVADLGHEAGGEVPLFQGAERVRERVGLPARDWLAGGKWDGIPSVME